MILREHAKSFCMQINCIIKGNLQTITPGHFIGFPVQGTKINTSSLQGRHDQDDDDDDDDDDSGRHVSCADG